MKLLLFFAASFVCSTMFAQTSLKEALYGGRLKNDSGSVVRKTDDIQSKIDTSQKKTLEIFKKDSLVKAVVIADSIKHEKIKENVVAASQEVSKDNNSLWKDFMEKLTTDIRTDVLPSKKIKSGTYSVLVDCEIDVTGNVAVASISSVPSNSFLETEIKSRISTDAPKMTPALNANGKPRKVNKKQTLSLTK